jgi:hypothetical protein
LGQIGSPESLGALTNRSGVESDPEVQQEIREAMGTAKKVE